MTKSIDQQIADQRKLCRKLTREFNKLWDKMIYVEGVDKLGSEVSALQTVQNEAHYTLMDLENQRDQEALQGND